MGQDQSSNINDLNYVAGGSQLYKQAATRLAGIDGPTVSYSSKVSRELGSLEAGDMTGDYGHAGDWEIEPTAPIKAEGAPPLTQQQLQRIEHLEKRSDIEAEAIQWLVEWDLWDDDMPPQQLERRFAALSKIQFGENVGWGQRQQFFKKLVATKLKSGLPIENFLAVKQTDIGIAKDPKFAYHLEVNNELPIHSQAPKLQPEQEKWLDDYLDDLEAKGVIAPYAPDEQPQFVTPLLLVPNAQSGQSYRVCHNIIAVNKRTPKLHHVLHDTRQICARLQRCKYLSVVDLKAGFHNIPLTYPTQLKVGFNTHRGKYKWLRMPFGLQNAPAHFQWVMEEILNRQHPDNPIPSNIYLDDVGVKGDNVDQLLEDTITAIVRIAEAGLMVNLNKSVIAADQMKVMGHLWRSGGYFTATGKKLLQVLEMSHAEICKKSPPELFGMLNFSRDYITDFAAKVEPIRQLLSNDARQWTPSHTELLKQVAKEALHGVQMINFCPGEALRVVTHSGPRGLAGALLQRDPEHPRTWLPVGQYSRVLTSMEKYHSRAELEVVAVHETLQRLQHMTVYAGDLDLELSPTAKALVKSVNKLHPTLQWRVVDILAYKPRVQAPQEHQGLHWCGGNEWADESASSGSDSDDEGVEQVPHRPVLIAPKSKFLDGPFIHVAFDGGQSSSIGTAGFVISLSTGQEVLRQGLYLGSGHTVNDAEVTALLRAIEKVIDLMKQGQLPPHQLRILGDSQLIMRFMLRIYKMPRKPYLYEVVNKVRNLIKYNNLKVAYRHVPRRLNSIPDAMCREAFAAQQDVQHWGGNLPEGAEELDIEWLYDQVEKEGQQSLLLPQQNAVWDEHLRGKPCKQCQGLRGEADMVVCDRCEGCYHSECANISGVAPVHNGPWYCTKCRSEIFLVGRNDPIEDVSLIDYLWLGKLPSDDEESERVLRLAKTFKAHGSELQVEVQQFNLPDTYRWVSVPPISMQPGLIADFHASAGHSGVAKTLSMIRQTFWWPSMKAQIAKQLATCGDCQRFRPGKPPTMAPSATVRPDAPFKLWSIDLAGPFTPDADGNCYAIIAVDVFSKWVEVGKLPSKHAWRTAEWFYQEIVCRWGRPAGIRMDHGTEWQGEFKDLLRVGLDISFIMPSTGNSAANGQAERMIRTFKETVSKEGVVLEGYWSDAISYALVALRMTTATAHGLPPFTVVTGQYPALPSYLAEQVMTEQEALGLDPSEEDELCYTQRVITTVQKLRKEVQQRLHNNDAAVRRKFVTDERAFCTATTIFDFQLGQLVMQRTRKLGKIASKASGPYRVIAIKGMQRQRVRIVLEQNYQQGGKPKARYVWAGTLAPYSPHVAEPSYIQVNDPGDTNADSKLSPPLDSPRKIRKRQRK